MVKAMKSSKEALTQRAFQSLPRHLRRRAASHNVRKLPMRLRVRAKQEVPPDSAKPKRKTRKMLGKKRIFKFINRADVLKRRQRFKIWLETHMWHAKRMHMVEIWGHRLATRPTMKAFRSSYRASKHGSLIHDASYFQYMTLSGSYDKLRTVLDLVCDPFGPRPASKRFAQGQREYSTVLYHPNQKPARQIGPIALIWNTSAAEGHVYRQVILRFHPSMAQEAKTAIDQAARANVVSQQNSAVTVTAHEREFLTFEVTGKRANEVVKGVLKPTLSNNEATKAAWNALDVHTGPGSVPTGTVIGLEVYDPRLSFPPQLVRQEPSSSAEPVRPSADLASLESFWSTQVRRNLRKPTFKKRELDERRSQMTLQNLVPGTRLAATVQDDRIPVLLVQRTLRSASSSSQSGDSAKNTDIYDMHGWTLMVPAGWGMPFWNSLVFTNSKVGGLDQRQQQSFESGSLHFPNDFVCSKKAFGRHELARMVDERGFWERKPKAKRVNYDKLGTDKPWTIDVVGVVESMWSRLSYLRIESSSAEPFAVNAKLAQRCVEFVRAEQSDSSAGEDVTGLDAFARELSVAFKLATGSTRNDSALGLPKEPLRALRSAVVHVRIDPVGRGKLEDYAMLYWLDGDRKRQVMSRLEQGKGRGGAGKPFEDEPDLELCDAPMRADVCGRVTTGGFSLSRGRGFGIGFMPLIVYLCLCAYEQDDSARLVLVKNPAGQVYRAANVALVSS
ncbi:Ribonucleases P/MRP protein subunit pop1 [Microbotryomycetes sp. JL201]|nr:Ribonucleases P/MRP protein subunit pop1 [Microbotryomycetes sp. JL201]